MHCCTEFHRFLKTPEDISKKISPEEKYEFKEPQQSPGVIAIEFDDSE